MKTFKSIYEVYDRRDNVIICQGTRDECEHAILGKWYYTIRLAKQELFTEDDIQKIFDYSNGNLKIIEKMMDEDNGEFQSHSDNLVGFWNAYSDINFFIERNFFKK